MSFKDVESWVCCTFIVMISYTLGTLTGIPTWSATDTKLSVFSNIATAIAGIATSFAAFYAYKSFQSWKDRTKEEHRIAQKITSFKELTRAHQSLYLDTFNLLQAKAKLQFSKTEWDNRESSNSREIDDYLYNLKMESYKARKRVVNHT